MLDFGQEKRAKSGSRGSEAAVQSSKAPAELFKVQMQQSCSSRGSEAAVQSSKFKCSRAAVQSPAARNFTNLVQNYTMYICKVTRI